MCSSGMDTRLTRGCPSPRGSSPRAAAAAAPAPAAAEGAWGSFDSPGLRPGNYCSPRHGTPFNPRKGGSKCVSMTWWARATPACPYLESLVDAAATDAWDSLAGADGTGGDMETRASRAGFEHDTDVRRVGDPTLLLLVGADTDAAHKGHPEQALDRDQGMTYLQGE